MIGPFPRAYAASKHGLEGMWQSLRRELMLYGIDVNLIEPGYVNIFIAEGRKGLAPRYIGEAVHTALTVREPQVVYTIVRHKVKNWTLPMLLPRRPLDRLIGKQLGLGSHKGEMVHLRGSDRSDHASLTGSLGASLLVGSWTA